ncbi:MAG: HEAT repeat domain-containing protein [Methylomicrobium sp.]
MIKEIGDLRQYLIKVLAPDSEVLNGTGFLCHPDGYALTCYHVITPWLKQERYEIQVIHGGQTYSAKILPGYSTEEGDIAVFRLQADDNAPPWPYLPLDTHWRVEIGHHLESFGYPVRHFATPGISILGAIGGLTPTVVGDVEVYPITGLNLRNVNNGYSGAPLINQVTKKVIGLVYAKYHYTQAFIAPLTPLFFSRWPELKDLHDIYLQIRERFADEAKQKLDQQLRGTTFIPLDLEQRFLPKKQDWEREQDPDEKDGKAQVHSQWLPLNLEQLLQPRDRLILTADVGTGKTTLFLWLVGKLIEKPPMVPLFLTCAELERSRAYHWDDLLNECIKRYETEFLKIDLKNFLVQAFLEKRLFLLLDGLDQIIDRNYSELARIAFEIANGNAVLITSRPSAVLVLESDPSILFLRLEPFSAAQECQYFGEYYDDAKKLSALAPELAQIPMLAYMIHTLVKDKAAAGLTTRTEIYQKFITHILIEHTPNKSISTQDWTLYRRISKVLSALAYHALAKPQPQIQRVEAELVDQVLGEIHHPVTIEDLTKFGLVNRVLERGENQLMFFTHQSFQEFLAAQHLANNPESIPLVLAERWHPKWREVIRFLSGLCGEPIIQQLMASRDNLIHADLFLAAHCLPEVKSISPDLKESIKSKLAALVFHPIFATEAMQLLSSLQEVTFLMPYLANSHPEIRRIAIQTLARHGAQMPAKVVNELAKRLKDDDSDVRYAAAEALAELGAQIPAKVVNQLIKRLEEEDKSKVRIAAAKALAGAQMPAKVKGQLIKRLEEDDDSKVRIAGAWILARSGERMPAEVMDQLFKQLEEDDNSKVRIARSEVLAGFWEQMPAKMVNQLIKRMEEDDKWLMRIAADKARMPAEEEMEDRIAKRLLEDDKWLMRIAADKALEEPGAQMPAEVEDRIAKRLAKRLRDDDRYVREITTQIMARALTELGAQMPEEMIGKLLGDSLQSNNMEVSDLSYRILKSLYQRGVPLPISKKLHCCTTIARFWSKLLGR